MDILTEKENGALTVRLSGRLDTITAPELEAAVREQTAGITSLVFDLNDLSYTSSAGLRVFLKAQKLMRQQGKMKLINVCEPSCIELPNGTLLCQFRAESGLFTVFQTRSADGGRTWSAPVQLLSDHGGSPPQLYLHSSGVLVSVYGYRSAPYGIRVMLSTDLGETWKTDLVLWDAGVSSDLGYPASAELNDGSLLTVFYAKDTPEGPAVIKQIRWKIV